MKKKLIILFAVLFAMIGAGATVAAPPASAAATYFSPGTISEHQYFGGALQPITFTNVGKCDGDGYYANLNNLSGDWDARITSLWTPVSDNGCKYVRIYCKNGSTYQYSMSSIAYSTSNGGAGRGIAVPVSCNDAVNGLRFYG